MLFSVSLSLCYKHDQLPSYLELLQSCTNKFIHNYTLPDITIIFHLLACCCIYTIFQVRLQFLASCVYTLSNKTSSLSLSMDTKFTSSDVQWWFSQTAALWTQFSPQTHTTLNTIQSTHHTQLSHFLQLNLYSSSQKLPITNIPTAGMICVRKQICIIINKITMSDVIRS